MEGTDGLRRGRRDVLERSDGGWRKAGLAWRRRIDFVEGKIPGVVVACGVLRIPAVVVGEKIGGNQEVEVCGL